MWNRNGTRLRKRAGTDHHRSSSENGTYCTITSFAYLPQPNSEAPSMSSASMIYSRKTLTLGNAKCPMLSFLRTKRATVRENCISFSSGFGGDCRCHDSEYRERQISAGWIRSRCRLIRLRHFSGRKRKSHGYQLRIPKSVGRSPDEVRSGYWLVSAYVESKAAR